LDAWLGQQGSVPAVFPPLNKKAKASLFTFGCGTIAAVCSAIKKNLKRIGSTSAFWVGQLEHTSTWECVCCLFWHTCFFALDKEVEQSMIIMLVTIVNDQRKMCDWFARSIQNESKHQPLHEHCGLSFFPCLRWLSCTYHNHEWYDTSTKHHHYHKSPH